MEEKEVMAAERLASAAEALEQVIRGLQARQDELAEKVDRIVAAIDERERLDKRVEELETELKASEARPVRKTMSPMVTAVLAKGSFEGERIEAAQLDRALGMLNVEQRIAVKAEMARAGMIE